MSAAADMMSAGRQAYNEKNLELARQRYFRAAEISAFQGDLLSKAKALRHLSEINRELGHGDTAQTTGMEAVEIYRMGAGVHPLDLANALRVTALAYQSLGKSADATALWGEARQLYENVGVPAGMEECDANLAPSAPRDVSS